MFGKDVYVNYKGKDYKVFVLCTPKTPISILKEQAIIKLKRIEEKYDKERFYWAVQRMNNGFQV